MSKGNKKKKNFKENFLKRNYKQCSKFLKESKNYIWAAVLIFIVSAIFAYLFPIFFQQEIIKFIEELSEKTAAFNMYELIFYIFVNNLKASFISLALGIFAGVFPIITAISNGYLVGFVSNYVIAEEGILVLWRLLPHGIFEIPAVMISIGLGIKLGAVAITKHNLKAIKQEFKEDLRVFILIIIPLLILAGIIEGVLISLLK